MYTLAELRDACGVTEAPHPLALSALRAWVETSFYEGYAQPLAAFYYHVTALGTRGDYHAWVDCVVALTTGG